MYERSVRLWRCRAVHRRYVCGWSVWCVCVGESERGLDLEATELADDAAVWQLEGAALVCCQSCEPARGSCEREWGTHARGCSPMGRRDTGSRSSFLACVRVAI